MEAHTEKLIAALTNAQLVVIYNHLSERSIKKFSDSKAAQKRVAKIMDEHNRVLRNSREGASEALEAADGVWMVRVSEATDAPKPRKRTEYQDSYRIEVRVGQNPKRKSSRSHARFALYRDGMTVGEYKAACVKLEGADAREPYGYLADLRWDEERQFITVWTPELIEEIDPEERRYAPAED